MPESTKLIACVTGGTGLVGRRIVSALRLAGYRVRVLSRKQSGLVQGVEFYQGDLCDDKVLTVFLAGAKMVFHCAAELNDDSSMWDVNVKGTEKVLDICRKERIEYFCFISSAGVVGRASDKLISEEAACYPQNAYEHSKLAAEKLVCQGVAGASVVILRPTNVIDNDKPGALALPIYGGFINKMKVFLKGAECAHVVHAYDVAAAAVFFSSIRFDSPECFFVSCDDEGGNTFAGLWWLYNLESGHESRPIHLPLYFPYLLRRFFRGGGNKGDVRYSPAKLKAHGFVFQFNLKGIVGEMVSKYGR